MEAEKIKPLKKFLTRLPGGDVSSDMKEELTRLLIDAWSQFEWPVPLCLFYGRVNIPIFI